MAAAKKPRAPKPTAPHPELHRPYVDAILQGMWQRTTGIHHLQGAIAAKLSKAIRSDLMPLPDGRMPSPTEVEEIVAFIRGNGRGFTLALVDERWQRAVDMIWDERGNRRPRPMSNAGSSEPSRFAGPRPLTVDDV